MQFTKHTFENGLRLITVPMKDNPTVTVSVVVETGSKYEEDSEMGLSHFLEHMCFKGTEKRPSALSISRELDSLGAHYNAFTSREVTGYFAKSRAKNFAVLLDVVSDIYLNSTFPEKEIEKEKGVIIEEIRMYNDQPQEKVSEHFQKLLYGDTPSGRSVGGTEESVLKMTRADFVSYKHKHYVATSTIVIVAGNIDEEKVQSAVENAFAEISTTTKVSRKPTPVLRSEPIVSCIEKETDQTHIILGLHSFPYNHEYTPALKVLSMALGGSMSSRLFQKLREEMGVCYYISAQNSTGIDSGVFEISAGVDKKRVVEVAREIIKELSRFKTELMSDEELHKIKEYASGMLLLGLESSDSLADFCSSEEVVRKSIRTPEEVIEQLRKVTALDVQASARVLFQNHGLILAGIGKEIDTEELKRVVKFES